MYVELLLICWRNILTEWNVKVIEMQSVLVLKIKRNYALEFLPEYLLTYGLLNIGNWLKLHNFIQIIQVLVTNLQSIKLVHSQDLKAACNLFTTSPLGINYLYVLFNLGRLPITRSANRWRQNRTLKIM
jgi:hypothetical protein